MHAAAPPTPLEPAEAWPLLRNLFAWLIESVGGLTGLVRRGRISRALWRDMNRHARTLERVVRQMLLAMQIRPRIVRVQPFHPAHPIARGNPHPGDDPRKWSVSFRLFPATPHAKRHTRTTADLNEERTVCARNFAARLEAVRRVIVSPGRAARRLGIRLQRSAEADEDRHFDALSKTPHDPRPNEYLFARTALTMERIRAICRDVWRRRRDYLASLPPAKRCFY